MGLWSHRCLGVLVAALLLGGASCTHGMEMSNDEIAESRLGAVEVVVAIERYFADSGEYPVSLGALVPAYLATLPRDAWGEDYEYRQFEIPSLAPYLVSFSISNDCGCAYYVRWEGWKWECSCGAE
jgi:hypothetical protein